MTPEQARQKWCPFSRIPSNLSPTNPPAPVPQPGQIQVIMPPQTSQVAINRRDWDNHTSSNLLTGTKCIADQCMAWRNVLNDTNDGHCGLAGFQPHGG